MRNLVLSCLGVVVIVLGYLTFTVHPKDSVAEQAAVTMGLRVGPGMYEMANRNLFYVYVAGAALIGAALYRQAGK